MHNKKWWWTGFLTALIIGGSLCWIYRWSLYDWWRLIGYQPPATVQNLADVTTMTPYARHLFYVYHPQLQDSSQFNKNCNVSPQAIVLGCTVIGRGIYIYNITDPEVNGIVQVTAAYEMLHVAYSRLSSSERTKIDAMVESAYSNLVPKYPFLQTEEQSYQSTEGSAAVPNELHSMLGTEVSSLPPALANYYSQYFTNRQKVVNFENQYQSAFLKRQKQVSQDDLQLQSWQQQINDDESNLTTQEENLNNQKSQLNQMLSSGQVATYNNLVNSYNANVAAYNNLVAQVKSLINQYNQLVVSRNQLTIQVNNLIQAISSVPNTINPQ